MLMQIHLFANTRRRLLVLALAALIALGASYAPVVLDSTANTTLTPAVFACGPAGGGC